MGSGVQSHAPVASTPGKDPVPIIQEAGWAPGPVWTGGTSLPHRDSIPDRPASSSVAIPAELPGHALIFKTCKIVMMQTTQILVFITLFFVDVTPASY